MEILFLIGGFFLLFILIAPLINAFGSNSPHKDKSQAEKKELALKDIKKNYDTSKDLFSKGLQAISEGAAQLEKAIEESADRAEKYRKEEYEKDYHRMKAVWKEQNNKRIELGLKEVSLVEFFEYNKDYQERARKELEALEAKKRGERLALLIEEHNKLEIELFENDKLPITSYYELNVKGVKFRFQLNSSEDNLVHELISLIQLGSNDGIAYIHNDELVFENDFIKKIELRLTNQEPYFTENQERVFNFFVFYADYVHGTERTIDLIKKLDKRLGSI
mgnify:CR=1 FL=1